ncbi:MAG: CHAD domain-containing protein [Alphaproteobacteria bacterium]|nr:CHAD domain-containing protein [Alphaproteobacteria bacterium]
MSDVKEQDKEKERERQEQAGAARNGPLQLAGAPYALPDNALADVARNVRRAAPLNVGAQASASDLVAAAINECLDQYTANAAVFLAHDTPDSVHQMRVALRRLRVFFGLFGKKIPAPEFEEFRIQAGALGSAFGLARDLDVFTRMVAAGPALVFHEEEGMRLFLAACERRRAEGYGAAHAALAAPQTQQFVHELREYAARQGWRDGLDGEAAKTFDESAKTFALRALKDADRKCRKLGKLAATLSAEQKHALRIRFKRLRYALEGFGALAGSRKRISAYGALTARAQDALGSFNDLVTARAVVGQLRPFMETSGAEYRFSHAAGIVLGWCAHGQDNANAPLIAVVDAFRAAQRPWD